MKQLKNLESLKQQMFDQKILNSEIVIGGGNCCSCGCVEKVVGKEVLDVCKPETTLVMNQV